MIFDIRPATADDADEIGYVHATSWLETYTGLINDEFLAALSPEKSAEKFRETGCRDTLVLTADNRVVGFTVSGRTRDNKMPGSYGDIHAIYILKPYQRRGYGSKLLSAAIEKLRREGFDGFTVWVLESNQKACAFYEKFGFESDGTQIEHVYVTPVLLKRYLLKNDHT